MCIEQTTQENRNKTSQTSGSVKHKGETQSKPPVVPLTGSDVLQGSALSDHRADKGSVLVSTCPQPGNRPHKYSPCFHLCSFYLQKCKSTEYKLGRCWNFSTLAVQTLMCNFGSNKQQTEPKPCVEGLTYGVYIYTLGVTNKSFKGITR